MLRIFLYCFACGLIFFTVACFASVENTDPNLNEPEEMSYFSDEPGNSALNFDQELIKQEKIFKEIVAVLKANETKKDLGD